ATVRSRGQPRGAVRIPPLSPEAGSPARQIPAPIGWRSAPGRLGRGEPLPSVPRPAAEPGAAPGTVAKAYRWLEADGLLVSRAGSGTRVSDLAAPVSSSVAQAARRLAGAARREGLSLEETVRVLRSTR